MRRLRASLSPNDSARRFTSLGVDVFLGEGQFTGPETSGRRRLAPVRKAAICTGAAPPRPDIPGIAEAGYLTNESVFNLTELPPRLAVLGRGRSAASWRRRSPIRQPRDGHRASGRIFPATTPRPLGSSRTGCRATAWNSSSIPGWPGSNVEPRGKSSVLRHVEQPRSGSSTRSSWAWAGLRTWKDWDWRPWVSTTASDGRRSQQPAPDHQPESSPPETSASAYKFTHVADALAQIVIQNALFPHPLGLGYATTDRLIIPWCTYTDPELSHVGLSGEADERGRRDRHVHRQARRGRPGHARRRDGRFRPSPW